MMTQAPCNMNFGPFTLTSEDMGISGGTTSVAVASAVRLFGGRELYNLFPIRGTRPIPCQVSIVIGA